MTRGLISFPSRPLPGLVGKFGKCPAGSLFRSWDANPGRPA